MVTVRGRVVQGGQPIPEIVVSLVPIGSTKGSGAIGATDELGKFTLIDMRGASGAHPGQYRVHLYTASDSVPGGASQRGSIPGRLRGLPNVYLSPRDTPLRVEIPLTGGELEIAISDDCREVTCRCAERTER